MTQVAAPMILFQRYRKYLTAGPILTAVLILMSLSGCTNEDINNSDSADLELPQLLQRMTVPTNGTLSATVTIDKGTENADTRNMTVDTGNNRLSFSGTVSSGSHDFLVELYYSSPSVSKVRLVSASKTLNVSGNSNITFADGDYIFDDNDSDNFTNVVEIESNSNPFSSSSIPDESVADDNYESNNTYATAYDITSLQGTYFNNSVKTNTRAGRLTLVDSLDAYKITVPDSTNTIEIRIAYDYGLFWEMQYISNGDVVVPSSEIFLDEDVGYQRQSAYISTSSPGDYYLIVYSPDDALAEGSYAFGWY